MTTEEKLGPGWWNLLSPVFASTQMETLERNLATSARHYWIVPSFEDMFNAFKYCQPEDMRVLIIGQDPYPGRGVAHGLAFSTLKPPVPASLRIIFQELAQSGFPRTEHNLTDWAEQGVLLLNTALTTIEGTPFAHKDIGWSWFIAQVLKQINKFPQKFVTMAWGSAAQDLANKYIEPTDDHIVLKACHPMAQQYSGGRTRFVGCGHFTMANKHLDSPIKW